MAEFVVLVSEPVIVAAELPEEVPVIPLTVGADHEYVVPVGTIFPVPLVGAILNDPAEQIVAVCAITFGFGFTVTVAAKLEPMQLPDVGVTV
jgi:hypothetical protein